MTHDQIDRLVRRANPLPDPNVLTPVDAPVPTTERRMEMQTDDRVVIEGGGPSGRRGLLVGIAIAAVILVAGAIFLLSNDDPPVATPAPNATDIRDADDGSEEPPLAPGAYFVDTDGDEASSLRGTFVIEGSGWSSLPAGALKASDDGFVALLVVEVDEVWPQVCPIPAAAPIAAGSTATDLANQFAAFGFTVREALAPVNAFGQNGHHLLMQVPELCSGEEYMAWAGPIWAGRYYQDSGQIVEYWFLDVEGTPVMVEANWLQGSPEEDLAELRDVLDTLVITP
jgi:hypothetical protein